MNPKRVPIVALLCAAILSVSALPAFGRRSSSVAPARLTCEYAAEPLIDVPVPRLSWIDTNPSGRRGAAQTAYRIRVAAADGGFDSPLWDTGRVESAESTFIPYGGPALRSRATYVWQVMVWDEELGTIENTYPRDSNWTQWLDLDYHGE